MKIRMLMIINNNIISNVINATRKISIFRARKSRIFLKIIFSKKHLKMYGLRKELGSYLTMNKERLKRVWILKKKIGGL